jgi:hypothetical protein
MRTLIAVATAALLASGVAFAQTATESTTTTEQSTPMAPAPQPGVLSTTHEAHAQDSMGDSRDSKSTSYRDANGAVSSSSTTTTQAIQPPPPPATTTTSSSSTQSTTTAPPQ